MDDKSDDVSESANLPLEEIAYHEAGHAVALHVGGLSFNGISIKPDSNAESLGRVSIVHPEFYCAAVEGSVQYTSEDFPKARFYMENLVIAGLAGRLAQERYAHRPPDLETCKSDIEHSLEHIYRFVGSDRTADAYLRFLWEMATDLVNTEHIWGAIETVAAALLERKTIAFSDASELIQEGMLKGQ